MAGYFIYSLDWDKFHRFVEEPSRTQLLAFAEQVSDGLDESDEDLKPGDPVSDWPSEPEELCEVIRPRLASLDWYSDLSDAGKSIWERAIIAFSERRRRGDDLSFRCACDDSVYWDVIEIARRYHGVPLNRITDAAVSHFGARPYRYHPPADRVPEWGDWTPYHSMHTPDEVVRLLEELKAAGPSILAAQDDDARGDYERLLPAVEKVARDGRLLYVGVDT